MVMIMITSATTTTKKWETQESERFHFLLTPLTTRTFTIKCRLSGSEAEAEEYTITMLIPTLCDWFSRPSTPICDFEDLVFT